MVLDEVAKALSAAVVSSMAVTGVSWMPVNVFGLSLDVLVAVTGSVVV